MFHIEMLNAPYDFVQSQQLRVIRKIQVTRGILHPWKSNV